MKRTDIRLLEFLDPRIQVFDKPYDSRVSREYFSAAVADLFSMPRKSAVTVFIDPDTGLAVSSDSTHVGRSDLELVWLNMANEDTLVLYQHQQRVGNWRQKMAKEFADALGIQPEKVGIHYDAFAYDVCFLSARKRPQARPEGKRSSQ